MSRSIRLVAMDADNTLLDSNLEVPDQVRDAISKVQKYGVHVTIATGRMLKAIAPIARSLHITTPIIAYNGAWIGDGGGNTIIHNPLPQKVLLPLAKIAHELNMCLNMYIDHDLYIDSSSDEPVLYYENLAKLRAKRVDLVKYLGAHPDLISTKALFIMDKPDEKLFSYLKETFYDLAVTTSKPRFIEIMAPEVSKGAALKALARYLKVPRESVMAIGDSFNDLEMLQYAGVGVAMANGVKKLQEIADVVVPSNDKGGVAVAIERFILEDKDKEVS